MTRLFAAILALALLTGCEQPFVPPVSNWPGAPADDLLRQNGPPTARATLSDGRQVWDYIYGGTRTYQSPTTDLAFVPSGGTVAVAGSRTSTERYRCGWRFVIGTNNIIETATFVGSNC